MEKFGPGLGVRISDLEYEYKVQIEWYKILSLTFGIVLFFCIRNNNKNILRKKNAFQSSRERSSTPSSIGPASTQSLKFRRGSESTNHIVARNSSPPIIESEESESEAGNKNVVEIKSGFRTAEVVESISDDYTTDNIAGAVSKSSKNKSENNRETDIYFPFKKSYPKPSPENPEIHVSELVYASREFLKVYGMLMYALWNEGQKLNVFVRRI